MCLSGHVTLEPVIYVGQKRGQRVPTQASWCIFDHLVVRFRPPLVPGVVSGSNESS